jgi:hypothetical protein
MYSYIYRLIQKILIKKSFNEDIINLLLKIKINHIIDIGCADSTILSKIKNKYFYSGYDIDNFFINKSEIKYKKKKKFNFFNTSINKIDFSKFNSSKSLIILIGVFHHISNNQVKNFIKKTSKFKVLAIDAVKILDQNWLTKLLLFFDKGKYIRTVQEYKKNLKRYNFLIARNRYLRFPYDHIISFRNLNKKKLKNILLKL